MKHRWSKCEEAKQEITFEKHDIVRTINTYKCQECITCGLRKGMIIESHNWRKRTYRLVYFKEEEFLSYNVLPYKCLETFLDESDFSL